MRFSSILGASSPLCVPGVMCLVSIAPVDLFTPTCTWSSVFAVLMAAWLLYTTVCTWYAIQALSMAPWWLGRCLHYMCGACAPWELFLCFPLMMSETKGGKDCVHTRSLDTRSA